MDKHFTIEMAAKKIGVHAKTIRRYIGSGKISAQKIAGSWRINADSLEEYLSSCEVNKTSTHSVSKDDFCIFMDSEYFDSEDVLQVCTIVDYYVQEDCVKSLLKDIMEVIAQYSLENKKSRFNYVYDDVDNKMRFVFWGAPSYIEKILQVMKPYEKK